MCIGCPEDPSFRTELFYNDTLCLKSLSANENFYIFLFYTPKEKVMNSFSIEKRISSLIDIDQSITNSPLRMTGTTVPSYIIPSTDISPFPNMKSSC